MALPTISDRIVRESLTVHIKLSVQLRLHSAKVAFFRFKQFFYQFNQTFCDLLILS